MAEDEKGSSLQPNINGKGELNEEENRRKESKRKKEEYYSSDEDAHDAKHSRSKRKKDKHKKSRSSKRRSRSKYSDESDYSSSSESESESSDSESESGSWSGESDSEEETRRRKRRERRRRRKEKEKKRKRKEKEKKRKRKEKEKEKGKKRKKSDKDVKDAKKKKKDKIIKGAVTNSWGKHGIIRETDMWNKRPEFTAWLLEVKKVNLESLPNWEEKQMFKEFMEDHNTATFPSSKYYDLDAYHRRKIEKQVKKGSKILETERTIFNDEEIRRQEMILVREKQKEKEVEVLKRSMQSGMAQAMKEQAQLREEMAYQYKLGNFEAAAAIQRRLDPDVAM